MFGGRRECVVVALETGWTSAPDLVWMWKLKMPHSPRGYEEVPYSHTEAFWGRAGQVPKLVGKWLESTWKERRRVGFFVMVGAGAGVKVLCVGSKGEIT